MVAPQTLHSATQTTYNLGKSVIQKSKATAVAVTGSSRWQASPLRMGSWLKYFKLKIWGKSESAFQKRVRERIQNPLHQPPSDIHPIWLDTNGVGHLRVEKSAGRTFVPDAAESINKDVAERLLITNTIQGQAKALPSARVVRFVRSLLNLNRKLEPWLFWVGLADKKYTNRLEAWTTNVENQAATKIQRLFRQKRLRPDLNPEQQAKIQQSIRNRLDQIEKYKKSVSLSYEDKVIDGLQARGSIIKSKWARSLEKDMPLWAVVVNRSQDRMLQHHLAHFEHHLQGHPSLQKLRQALVHPEQMTDQSDEVMALKQLMGWVNQPFVSKLSFATANVLYDDLARRVGATNPFVKEFGSIYQIGKLKRSFKPLLFGDYTLPLGHVLESGAGVCRHRALWTKVLLDDFSQSGLASTYSVGTLRQLRPASNSVFRFFNKLTGRTYMEIGHAWNRVKFPGSQREYLFDPMGGMAFDLSNAKHLDYVQKRYKELT